MAKVVKQTQTATTTTEKSSEASTLQDHETIARALNAFKNQRRVLLLRLLDEKSCVEGALQTRLRSSGYNHSLSTIKQYLQPLVEAELVRYREGKYSTTIKAAEILSEIGKTNFLLRFPANSSCFEELSLIAIKNGYRTFDDLSSLIDVSMLPRALNRLQEEDLIRSNHPKDHVQFYRVRIRLLGEATPTERRVFHTVNQDGISVKDLAKAVGITVRRTYKYLARLKKRGLILQRSLPVTYELTPTGKIVADFIERIITCILDRPVKTILYPSLNDEEHGIRGSLAIIQQYEGKGILQSDLWRRLGLDSRKGSRHVLNLERRGFIERRKELDKGRWTFRILAKRKTGKVDTIMEIPCASCDEDYKGMCPTHILNPATCGRMTHWVVDLNQESP